MNPKTRKKHNDEGTVKQEQKSSPKKYLYALGRRKTAVARVRLIPGGKGSISINNRALLDYFPFGSLAQNVSRPLEQVGMLKNFDVTARVEGGGVRAQAESVRLAIARALVKQDSALRKSLKPLGLLTRDPRKKERKKPGLKRARRAPQWQKR